MPAQRTPDSQPANFNLGEHNAVTPTLNDKDAAAMQFDSAGNLLVSVAVGGSLAATILQQGSANLSSTQVTVDTTVGGVQLIGARATRNAVMVVNLGTVDVYIGTSGVTTGTGTLLLGVKGAYISIPTTAAVFGICGSSQAVSVIEVYN